MADKVSKEKRSEVMRQVKSANTKPEILVRKFLFSSGYRYRLHDKKLPGKPDIKLSRLRAVIFVNGCFWHKHEICKTYQMPKSNEAFWEEKIRKNKERDINNIGTLKAKGWEVYIIWECELKKAVRDKTFLNLLVFLKGQENRR